MIGLSAASITRLALAFGALSLALILLVLAAARAAPDADQTAWQQLGFTTCELPCYAGIVPGQFYPDSATLTELVEAGVPQLTQIWAISGLPGGGTVLFHAGTSADVSALSGTVDIMGSVVDDILLHFDLSLGALLLRLGQPTCIALYPPDVPNVITAYWDSPSGATVASGPLRGAFTPALRVTQLVAGQTDDGCGRTGDDQAWRGFAPISWYTRASG